MSELGGGRATNGGARTGGPVPVSSSNIRPPTEIMRARQAREARRREEQKAEELRRAEERRRSAERRVAALPGAAPRVSGASSQYTPDMSSQQAPFEGRSSGAGWVAGSSVLGDPTGRGDSGYSSSRIQRGPTVPQKDQPRPAPATADDTRRARPSQSAPRQPNAPAPPAQSQSQQRQQAQDVATEQRTGPASFPHAFERWETLSSHWEGLTSYWLHKLESNTEQMRDTVPNAQTLNRQITDLSAAGANLFAAVVELQRLRASSERKFSRWFIDTRAELDESHGIRNQLQERLKADKADSTQRVSDLAIAAENAKREVAEVRRELSISKEEARRAWEELGRRNQEAVDAAQSLNAGEMTVVHGIEVTPYLGGMSRGGSLNQRPPTRDPTQQYGAGGMPPVAEAASHESTGDAREYYQEENSPTNTDPFLESGQEAERINQAGSSLQPKDAYQPPYYSLGSAASRASPAQTTSSPRPARTTQESDVSGQLPEEERFYQHGPQDTFLHYPREQTTADNSAARQPSSRPRESVHSEESYVESLSEGGTEYVIDAAGNVRHDDQGRPIVFTRRAASGNNGNGNGNGNSSSEYDTAADIRREQELAAQYGSGMLPNAARILPSTSSEAMASYSTTAGQQHEEDPPGYEGAGYGGEYSLPTRHHHPTRLSDVLEEEEERSVRRTGD